MKFRYWRRVKYVAPWRPAPVQFSRCLTCGRAWDDDKSTDWTPVPSGRCPFEYWHTKRDRERPEPSYETIQRLT